MRVYSDEEWGFGKMGDVLRDNLNSNDCLFGCAQALILP